MTSKTWLAVRTTWHTTYDSFHINRHCELEERRWPPYQSIAQVWRRAKRTLRDSIFNAEAQRRKGPKVRKSFKKGNMLYKCRRFCHHTPKGHPAAKDLFGSQMTRLTRCPTFKG